MAKNAQKHAHLSNLPNEIITRIIGFISRPSCLKNLCLVNKLFRSLAELLLYSAVVLEWGVQSEPPIIKLLETLAQRPELLAHIHTLSLHGRPIFFRGYVPRPLEPSELALQLFIPIIQKLHTGFTDEWVESLRAGSMDAFVALLIAQLTQVRRLVIVENFLVSEPDFVARVLLSRASGRLPKFDRLDQLVFSAPATPSRSTDSFAVVPFYLTTVREMVVSVPDFLEWPFGPSGVSHLTLLVLNDNYSNPIDRLLSETPHLKSLSWQYEYNSERTRVGFEYIMGALSHVKGTLESLQLRIDPDPGPYNIRGHVPELAISGSLDGLADFDRIVDLDVPLLALTGFGPEAQPLGRHIPKSVERLSLSSCMIQQHVGWLPQPQSILLNRPAVEAIQGLLRGQFTRPPGLRQIRLVDTDCCLAGQFLGRADRDDFPFADDIDVESVRDNTPPWTRHVPRGKYEQRW